MKSSENDLTEEALQNVQYHEVVYENDLEDQQKHQITANRIFDYLSLERREVHTQFHKVNANPIKDTVVNYDEFITCVRENGWEGLLD